MADATTLTPEEIQQLGEPIERIYASMTNELLINIGKHITRPTTTHTAAWEIQKLSEMGALTKENARIINKWIKDVPKLVRDTMEETRREALKRVEAEIERQSLPEAKTPPVAKATVTALKKYSNQLENETEASKYYTPSGAAWRVGEQLNLVHTTMLRSSVDKYANAIQQTVTKAQALEQANATQRILNQKTANVVIGKDTLQAAKRDAIRQIAKEGLAGFYDKAGRQWTPEAYVNMDIRTTVHNVAITAIQNDMVDHGVDVFQVSSHAAARPLCYPYQGKFFSWSVGDSGTVELGNGKVVRYDSIFNTTYGQAAGLFGINCGHYPIPIVPGVTIPHGADDIQSEEVNDRAYKESQVQRALERDIRAAKRDLEMLGDTATDEDRQRLKKAQEKMATFIADTGRSRRTDREAVFMAKPGQTEAFKFPDTSPQGLFPREHSDVYREFTTGEQATEAFAADYSKWNGKLTEKQRDAIGIYTSDGYKPVNQMLRGELTKSEVQDAGQAYTMSIDDTVKALDAGIKKYNLDQPIRVYRTVDDDLRAQLDAALGGTYHDSAYMSTSVTPRAGGTIIQIDVPAGKGHGAWVDPLAQYGGDENEFLLARGTTLNVKHKYVNAAGQVVYEAEYVSSKPDEIRYIVVFKDEIAEIQKQVLNGKPTTDQIYAAGKLLANEYAASTKPEAIAQRKAVEGEIATMKAQMSTIWQQISDASNRGDMDEWNRLFGDYVKINDQVVQKRKDITTITEQYQSDSTKWLSSKLSEVRQIGAGNNDIHAHLSNSKSDTWKPVAYAYDNYPTEWVDKSVQTSTLKPIKKSRGYYSSWAKEIAISGTGNARNPVAFHELGHRFEDVVPGIKEQEQEFYKKRTQGERLQWLGAGYAKTEQARKDNFLDAYMGKEYSDKTYELVSMGMQYAYTDPEKLAKDKDMQEWIYGMLCLE